MPTTLAIVPATKLPGSRCFLRLADLSRANFHVSCSGGGAACAGEPSRVSFVERELARIGISVAPVISLGSTEAIKLAVAAGIGVAIVSRLSIDLEVEARRLRVIPVSGLSIKRPLYQVQAERAQPPPALIEFRRCLKEAQGR